MLEFMFKEMSYTLMDYFQKTALETVKD